MVEEEFGIPDEENPEWTAEMFASAMRFKDLPPQLQRTLTAIQNKSKARRELEASDNKQKQIPCGNDNQEKQEQGE